jgi:methylmalonyl-CoA epimerase
MALDIDHVGIAVANSADVVAFYERVMGLRTIHQEDTADGSIRLIFLAPADGHTTVELVEPLRDGTPLAKFLAERGPGMHHICFRVADIRAELKRLAALGFELIDAEPRQGSRGHLVAFVHPRATHGVLIELCQHGEHG